MENSKERSRQIPAYASYLSFVSLLDWLKGMDQVPRLVDPSLWRTKFSGATGSALMSSGRFLGLLVDERPTPRLQDLVRADEQERKKLILQMVCAAYGDDVIEQLPTMTPRMLDDHLRELGATEGTIRKASSFLINALKAAEVQVPPAIAKRARNRPSKPTRRGKNRNNQPPADEEESARPPADSSLGASGRPEPQIQRTCELGEGVVAMLTVRGDILNMANAAKKMVWLQSVIQEFDKGATEPEESEEAADS